jgi:tetratricopeptide (TPR) repeat protein
VIGFWHSLAGLSAVLTAKKRGIPAWIEVQSSVEESLFSPWQVIALYCADGIMPCSERVGKRLGTYFGLSRDRVTPFVNRVRADRKAAPRRYPGRNGPFTVTMVGRFHVQKDYVVFFRAARILAKRGPYRFLAVGGGEFLPFYRELAARYGLDDRVEFRHFIKRIDPVLDETDLFCLATRFEGLPLTVLEAMNRGLPVVATRVDGIPEAVCPGRNGLLVPPGNAPSLARAIEAVRKDGNRYRRFSRAALETVRNGFDLQGRAKEFETLLERENPRVPRGILDGVDRILRGERPAGSSWNRPVLQGALDYLECVRSIERGETQEAIRISRRIAKADVFPGSRLERETLFALFEAADAAREEKTLRKTAALLAGKEKRFRALWPQRRIVRYHRLASTWKRFGFKKAAENLYREITRNAELFLDREAASAWYHLGELYARRGEKKRAHRAFSRCLKLVPGHGKAAERRKACGAAA